MEIYQNNCSFEQIYSFNLLWKNYGTMEKTMILWKNYGTISKTMELCFTMKTLW